VTNKYAQVSQVLALIVGETPPDPTEIDLASSVVEFWYSDEAVVFQELDLAASVVEFWYAPVPTPIVPVTDIPVAQGFVPGPRWQEAGGV